MGGIIIVLVCKMDLDLKKTKLCNISDWEIIVELLVNSGQGYRGT